MSLRAAVGRAVAAAAVTVLISAGTGTVTASAHPGSMESSDGTRQVITGGDVGVQHIAQGFIAVDGNLYRYLSVGGPDLPGGSALTELARGSNPHVRVRVETCPVNNPFSCTLSPWFEDTSGRASVIVASTHFIRRSFHSCGGCTQVFIVDHSSE